MIFQYEQKEQSPGTVSFYQNGNTGRLLANISICKKLTLTDLQKQFSEQLKFRKMRIFSRDGVQMGDEEMKYVKDKQVFYVSKGEQFDRNNILSEFNIIKEIGQGGFGKVVMAQRRINCEKVAIKFIKTDSLSNSRDIETIFFESEILRTLKHDNIIKVYHCQPLQGMQIMIVMEFLQGGQLYNYLTQRKRVSEAEAKVIFKQLIRAMDYCHQKGLIHRDLKLQNIMFVNQKKLHIKVLDFGIAGIINNIDPVKLDVGTLLYMAPQLFKEKKKVGYFTDVWSSGVILYLLLTGTMPFRGSNPQGILQDIQKRKRLLSQQQQSRLSKEAQGILQVCLQKECEKRPKMYDLLCHPWLEDVDVYSHIRSK